MGTEKHLVNLQTRKRVFFHWRLNRRSSTSSKMAQVINQQTSSIRMRSIDISMGSSVRGAGKVKSSSLKMAAMALGVGSGGALIPKELAVSPQQVVICREKEKLALQELNDRFAAYIERVRFLEADNKRLQGIIMTLTAKFEELDAILRAIYDEELCAARKALDETTAAKAAVELKVAGLECQVAELTAMYKAEYEAHMITKADVPKLEKMISERDATIDYLTKNVTSMDAELCRLKAQIASLQKDLAMVKQAADGECVARVELESLVATRDDEIAFLTNMYEQKIKALMAIDLGSDAFAAAFSNELALALRDIRAEYEAIIEATRTQDTESWYKAKFNEVIVTTQRATNDLTAAKQEVSAFRAKYQSLSLELTTMRAQLACANERIMALEVEMAAAAAQAEQNAEEQRCLLAQAQAQLLELTNQLKAVTDIKLALDAEIATYRRLLAGEETRFTKEIMTCGTGGGKGIGVGGGADGDKTSAIVGGAVVGGAVVAGALVAGAVVGGAVVGGMAVTGSATTTTVKTNKTVVETESISAESVSAASKKYY